METKELLTEETIPTEEATDTGAATDNASTLSEGSESVTEGAQSTRTTEEDSVADTFPIRYNHEDISLQPDEARRLAQIGMHYEKNVRQTLDALDYVATLQGKTVKDLVDEIVSGVDSAYREELVSELGAENPLVEELLEHRRAKNNKAYETAKAERSAKEKQAEEDAHKSATAKLAEQFEAVREIFPEYDTVEKVPDTVIKRAIQSGDLEKEMLRYERSERIKVEAAKVSQENNKNQNVGSVQTDVSESGISNAFMKGLWG